MRLAVKPFTLIGTAEKQSDCPRDLLNAFHAVLSFQPYNVRAPERKSLSEAAG
jgi:hypothetical protein